MNYYPFHIGDYISHTAHLSDIEDLAYRRMIDLYFLNELPFNDSSTVARKVKTELSIVENLLHEFFTFEDDMCWHSKRVDEEIIRYHSRLDQASKAGKASAQARFNARSTPVQPTRTRTNNHNHIKTNTPLGVSEEVFHDFLKMRNAMKAPVTETALKGLKREAEKAKMNLEGVMSLCCQNGWRGFKADWLLNPKNLNQDRKNKNITALHELTGNLLKPKIKSDDSIFKSINTIDMEIENVRIQQG